jgi:hypothetical protein
MMVICVRNSFIASRFGTSASNDQGMASHGQINEHVEGRTLIATDNLGYVIHPTLRPQEFMKNYSLQNSLSATATSV